MTPLLGAADVEHVATILFLDVAIIVVVARLTGALFKKVGQPPVIGEIIAGILLGPTLLGVFPGQLPTRIFPAEVVPFLKVVAQLGLIFFMFIVGLELDMNLIRGKERLAGVISVSSILLPFGLGILLAVYLRGSFGAVDGKPVKFVGFALFIGASMSITAFPVLARILTERGMYKTTTGALTLACAAVDDIMAWSLLAVVTAIVRSTGVWDLPRILGLSIAFATFMFVIVKPWLEKLAARYRRFGRLTPDILAVILVGVLLSSYITSKIGIHSIFGAFLFGVVMPRRDTAGMFHAILDRLEHVTVLLLLPVFFIATGLGVNVRGIGLAGLRSLALIVLVACVGKFVGAAAAAKAQGMPTRQALTVGTLMNTRGLTELVILNAGRDIGVLSPELFTLLVVMAVVTTVITEPVLRIVYPASMVARDLAESERAQMGPAGEYRVLLAIGNPANAGRLLDLGLDLIGDESPAELVLTRFVRLPTGDEIRSGLTAEAAEQAASADALHALAARVRERGVGAVVLSQLSKDFAADLVAQAAAVEADVLVLGWFGDAASSFDREAFARRVLRDAPCDVLVLVDPTDEGVAAGPEHPLLVAAGEGFHNGAALEAAVRIARSQGAPVRLVDVAGDDEVARSRRLAALAEQVQRAGAPATPCLADDGVTAEIARQAPGAGAVAAGIDEDWFRAGGTFGPGTDELVAAVHRPVLIVRAHQGLTRTGVGGFLERLQGRGREDETTMKARLAAAGPQPTHDSGEEDH